MIFFTPPSIKPEEMPVNVLAYIGDAVCELFIRQHLLNSGITSVHRLHKETIKYVRADHQAKAMRLLENGILNEAEKAIARRGRNTKHNHPLKGLNSEDYHYSTALETLIGFLYLKGKDERLNEIMRLIISWQGRGKST